ncbi:hypothetical protein ACLOJK_016065 [Asimina triloba]
MGKKDKPERIFSSFPESGPEFLFGSSPTASSQLFYSCNRFCAFPISLYISLSLAWKDGWNERDSNGEFKRICVFCGSRSGNRSTFSDAALQLGKLMAEKKINLVYGGGSVGLMGFISQTRNS